LKKESKTILLVEDEVLIAVIHKKILSKYGFDVVTAATGEKAVEIARSDAPVDLILMDINLGDGIDGTEAAEIILKIRNIPLVFLSSHTEPEVVDKTEGITSYGYIVKNSGETVLIAAIKMAFRLFETKLKVQGHLNQQEVLVEILFDLHKRMNQSFDDLMNYAIEASIKLTGSAFAFAGLLSEDESVMTIHAWSKDAMISCAVDEAPIHFPIDHAGVWGECVRQRRLVIINDYDSYAGRSGYPEGHVPITNFMAVPIFDGDRITAVGAVANSTMPYEITDVRSLISLYERLWEIIRRKTNEETLRESEERFKALHNASFGGIAIHDKGIILDCNQGLAEMTGYSADELIGMNGLLLIEEKSRDLVMKNILAGYEKPYEAYGLRKDGREFPMRLEARNVPYKGKTVRTVEFRDITEAKEYADRLRENEALLKNITDNMHDLVALTDMQGNFKFAAKSHNILGYEPEYLIGRNVMEFVHPEDISYVTEEFIKWLTEGQESAITEYRYRCADGSYTWLETVGRLIRDAEGNVKELVFSSRDVTEKREVEADLRKLAIALNQSPSCIVITGTDGIIEYVNPKFVELTGYSIDEAIGRNPSILQSGYTAVDVYSELWNTINSGKVWRGKFQNRKKNGELYWESAIIAPILNDQGKVINIMAIKDDITDMKKSEESISLLLKEKELLLKETHHRIKNNMNTVCGLLYLQAEELSDPISKGIIKEATSRVQSMMVMYDKLYRSENHYEMNVSDYLPSLIDEIIRIFDSRIPVKKDIHVDDVVLSAKALSALGIIINELITNSMKYAFGNVSEGLISLSLTKNDSRVTVVYRDNGPGFPESVDFENSTGFGMQLIAMLINQLGGDIRIERGEGVMFVFDFNV